MAKKSKTVAETAEVANTEVTTPNVVVLELLEIDPNRINVPIDDPKKLGRYKVPEESKLAALAYSMVKEGQQSPIRVVATTDGEEGTFDTVFGNSRTLAARMVKSGFSYQGADIKPQPGFVLRAELVEGDAKDLFVSNFTENAVRNELSVMDKAYDFRTAVEEHGMTQTRISQLLGVDKGLISKHIALTGLPTAVQDILHSGFIGMSHGTVLVTSDLTEDEMLEAIGRDDAPTIAELTERVRKIKAKKEGESGTEGVDTDANTEEATSTDERPRKERGTHGRHKKELVEVLRQFCISKGGSNKGKPNDNQSSQFSALAVAMVRFLDGDAKVSGDTLFDLIRAANRQFRKAFGEVSYEEEKAGEQPGSAPMK